METSRTSTTSMCIFWRWALWKVFEQNGANEPGIVSFITASSYLHGDAFAGMRQHLREICDEVWILDLGGEGRGSRKSENIFNIQTPVAIAIAFRESTKNHHQPAKVLYGRIDGTRDGKLKALECISDFNSVTWIVPTTGWRPSLRPVRVLILRGRC